MATQAHQRRSKNIRLEVFPSSKNSLFFRRLLKQTAAKLKLPFDRVSLIFVSSQKIKTLNKVYLSKNRPTDVLAFNQLNEIYICLEQAKKNAQLAKTSLQQELALLFVHGLLHLANFDHQTASQAKTMASWQEKILGQSSFRALEHN